MLIAQIAPAVVEAFVPTRTSIAATVRSHMGRTRSQEALLLISYRRQMFNRLSTAIAIASPRYNNLYK
ncbi:hypothetical protein HC766_07185 [Candidatus Gracilibacteria bacterium]|nr:hypothetical protein [Microcoleus sp. SU_5_3]NJS42025.1 hypothetical protein [Candidatus Gracilibacteria bacterium]